MSCLYGTLNNEFQDTSQLIFEPLFYHDPGSPGYFSTLVKRGDRVNQDSFLLSEMPFVLSHIDRRWDSWLSVNDFFRRNRRVANLLRINTIFLDLDTYKVGNLIDLKPEKSTSLLLNYCQNKGIPIPSVVLFSGRGLQVKWLPDGSLPRAALPRWNAVQRHLAKRLEPFGADNMALDASRVLRIDRTVNTKSGEFVKVLYVNCVNGDKYNPIRYDFDILADKVLPYTREEMEILRSVRAEMRAARAQRATKVDPMRWKFTQESLHWNRIEDMRTLTKLRGWEHGNPDGQRDPFIFLAAISLSWITPPTVEHPFRLSQELEALSRQFAPHWTGAKIRSHVSFIYKRFKAEMIEAQKQQERYRYTNQRALDMLHVTPDEEREMKILISKGEKRRRWKEAIKKIRRARGMLSRAEYEAQRLIQVGKRQKQAIEMRQKGLSYREIASQMGMTAAGISQLLKRC